MEDEQVLFYAPEAQFGCLQSVRRGDLVLGDGVPCVVLRACRASDATWVEVLTARGTLDSFLPVDLTWLSPGRR